MRPILIILCTIVTVSICLFGYSPLNSQDVALNDTISIFDTPSELSKKRAIIAFSGVGVAYVSSSVGLYNTWYKNYNQENFHFFNDWNEWGNMDKCGHIFTSYFQGVLGFKLAKWTGMKDSEAIKVGALSGLLFQTTIEVMDGFSSKWGFSIADMGANVLGTSTFVIQQKLWKEQRILLKMSSWKKSYSQEEILSETGKFTSSAEQRAKSLYGSLFYERFLKDYNAQSYWVSFNIHSFSKSLRFPKWLNIAAGYSTENQFGGFSNSWEINDENFNLENEFPRYKQYLLGVDIDFSKIKTKSKFLRMLFDAINFYKLPLPALEINSEGEFKFHLLFTN